MLDSSCAEGDRQVAVDVNQTDFSSSTDWRAKYMEVADMLTETRAELDDFHHASKELEAELENELQRTERAQEELKVRVARAESERDDWKTKFMSLQTTHNTTTTSLQRELDTLRQEHQRLKIQLRDLELGNDDLERNERAVSSSLADMEAKYSRALEEKILLEHELLEKASLEEEAQRLRDELRDANVEISILKDQLEKASLLEPVSRLPSEVSLLETLPPPDLQLDDLSSHLPPSSSIQRVSLSSESSCSEHATPLPSLSTPVNVSRRLQSNAAFSVQNPTVTSYHPVPSFVKQQSVPPRVAATASSSSSSSASRNKGVQMVSEMRARVRNLEQKIHTRVPRLRMASITGKGTNPLGSSTMMGSSAASSSSTSSRASTAKTSWESFTQRRSGDSRRSNESGREAKLKDAQGDSSGWVLILEDSPLPVKEKVQLKRRISSPSKSTNTARMASIPSPTLASAKQERLGQSPGLRRPQSRLSGGSLNTASSTSIPTPTSRPATPTFLPLPSSSLHVTSVNGGLKRSTGPNGPNPYNQAKRSSFGSSGVLDDSAIMPPPTYPATSTPLSGSKYNSDNSRTLPLLPGIHSNVTVRSQSRLPSSTSGLSAALSQSRIGRPGGSGRKSTDNSLTTATSSRAG